MLKVPWNTRMVTAFSTTTRPSPSSHSRCVRGNRTGEPEAGSAQVIFGGRGRSPIRHRSESSEQKWSPALRGRPFLLVDQYADVCEIPHLGLVVVGRTRRLGVLIQRGRF